MEGFNRTVDYIERHLEDAINYDEIAAIFGYSVYHVQRLFAMVAGTPLAEYIRNRRLSKAAADLLGGQQKVIDIALKYAYSSSTSFHHAFKAFHGISPSDVKKDGATIKAYPPLAFDFTIRGAQAMPYRIEQKAAFRIVGAYLQTTLTDGACYQAVPTFWGEFMQKGGAAQVLPLMNQAPAGLLGVCHYAPDFGTGDMDYYIGCASDLPVPEGMTAFTIPACTWAIFPLSHCKTDSVQQMERRIVMEGLPTSGYQFANAPDIEVYSEKGIEEIWLPIA
jgi:AraC family transcriptional regulator